MQEERSMGEFEMMHREYTELEMHGGSSGEDLWVGHSIGTDLNYDEHVHVVCEIDSPTKRDCGQFQRLLHKR